MVVVTKVVIVCCLLFVASVGGAGEPKINGEELVRFAYEKMTHAVLEANTKIGACQDKEKKTILPPQVFPKLALSKNEWGTVIGYLRLTANTRCEENALANALMAFSQFKVIEKEVTGKNAADVFPVGTYQYELEDLCCGSLKTDLKTEIKYKKIDPKIRQVLESIPELKEPFNAIAALKALGV